MDLSAVKMTAVDMDGTLLTTDKRILPETIEAISEAEKAGISVVLATGRAVAEIKEYRHALKSISYGITESGGLLYDFRREQILWCHSFDMEMREIIIEASFRENVILQAMAGGAVFMEEGCLQDLARHRIDHFAGLFRDSCTMVPDIRSQILYGKEEIEKINLYHTDSAARKRTRERLAHTGLELADSEYTSLEISPPGVCKGDALLRLCGLQGISIKNVAAIGDSDNDFTMLRAAGFPIAMGNANGRVKNISCYITEDCDHDGVGVFLRQLIKNAPIS